MHDADRYRMAVSFATEKHLGQYRIGGLPYITHPLAVAQLLREQGFDISYQIAGLFHDLLEDTDAAVEEITAIGGPDVTEAVRRLTKTEGYVMADYIQKIKENPIAVAVKAADRLHNLRCAVEAGPEFRYQYILESMDWYLDFSAEIPTAVRDLISTLDEPTQSRIAQQRPAVFRQLMHLSVSQSQKGLNI